MITVMHPRFWRKKIHRQRLIRLVAAGLFMLNMPDAIAQQSQSHAEQAQHCEKGKKQAQADLKAGKPRYYVFGIVPAKEEAKQSVMKQAGITLINMGCMVSMVESCYNEIINDWVKAETGKTVGQLMQETDKK